MDNFSSRGWKSWSQINFFTPLLSFFDENSRWTSRKVDHNFFTLTTASAVPSCSLQKLMDNFLAEGWKVRDSNQLFYPLRFSLWRKFTLNFPGKVDSQFLAHYSQCSTKRSLHQKWWTTFSEGVKSWFKSTSLPLLSFLDENSRWTSPRKLTHNFYAHYSQCAVPSVRFKKLMDNFSSRGEKGDSNQLLYPSSFLDEKSRWTSRESWLTILRSLQPVQYQAFASKNWWTTF